MTWTHFRLSGSVSGFIEFKKGIVHLSAPLLWIKKNSIPGMALEGCQPQRVLIFISQVDLYSFFKFHFTNCYLWSSRWDARLVMGHATVRFTLIMLGKLVSIAKISRVIGYFWWKVNLMFCLWFTLGGPGSGKGTQSLKIAERYGFNYISVGELLRKKIHSTSSNRKWSLIAKIITTGELAPQVQCFLCWYLLPRVYTSCSNVHHQENFLYDIK